MMLRKLSILLALLAFISSSAEARKRKPKPKPKPKTAQKAPKANAKAMAVLMGPFKMGMSPDQVLKEVQKLVEARYEEKLKQTRDVLEKKSIREKIKEEVKKVKKTTVAFEGK